MKKKVINILLCFVLMFQNIVFPLSSVIAETVEPQINIIKIVQGENELVKEGDNYIVDGVGQVEVRFEASNIIKDNNYYISTHVENWSGQSGSYNNVNKSIVEFNFNNQINKYIMKLCNTIECDDVVYDTKELYFKLADYEKISSGTIYIEQISQGDEILIPDLNTNSYNINGTENIKITLKGTNLNPQAIYTIRTSWDWAASGVDYSGAEIMAGVTITHYTKNHEDISLQYDYNHLGYNRNIDEYMTSDEYIARYYGFNKIDSETATDCEVVLAYKNGEVILKSDRYGDYGYDGYYIINSDYANAEKPLLLDIKGKNYKDKDYDIQIEVMHGDKVVYTKNIAANGLLINEGYKLELAELQLELNKTIEDAKNYGFNIIVGEVIDNIEAKYNSIGKDAIITEELFFENGKKNLSVFMGGGALLLNSGVYETNKDAFKKYETMYVRYLGKDFNDDETYQYTLEYIDNNMENFVAGKSQNIASGTITGKMLNTVGAMFEIDNTEDYLTPSYKFTVKKGEEAIYANEPVLRLVNTPTLANASLAANNKQLYIRTGDYSYIATKNAPIEVSLSGLGFDDEKTYDFNLIFAQYYGENENGYDYYESVEKTVQVTGKDINSGNAVVVYDTKIEELSIGCEVWVMCDATGNDEVPIQGGFNITFVDSKELVSNVKNYIVDNALDLIKDIKKQTTAKDFALNIDVKDNGTVKVFDKEGKTEVTGNVGTGMIARVLNEYGENILDMDVVVKGDVSGDGNISITDLVKVKRHVDNKENLTGVYEMAGSITDGIKVQELDLEKIVKDVASIEEVK